MCSRNLQLVQEGFNHGIKIGGLDVTSLVDAAKSGDKRATLVALRDILAKTIQECDSGRDMASNTKRLMEVISEIESVDREQEEARRRKEAEANKSKHDRLKKRFENG